MDKRLKKNKNKSIIIKTKDELYIDLKKEVQRLKNCIKKTIKNLPLNTLQIFFYYDQSNFNIFECKRNIRYKVNDIKKLKKEQKTNKKKQKYENKCLICLEECDSLIGLNCKHKACQDCLLQHLNFNLSNPSIYLAELKCIGYNCYKTYNLVFLNKYYPDIKQQYESLLKIQWVNIYCKKRKDILNCKCGKIIFIKKFCTTFDKQINFECSCKIEYCLICKKKSHYPLKCNQINEFVKVYEEIDQKAKKSLAKQGLKLVIANSKKCPQCNIRIQRSQGCDHMTCSACTHQFCWLCFQNWNNHKQQKCKILYQKYAEEQRKRQYEAQRVSKKKKDIYNRKIINTYKEVTQKMYLVKKLKEEKRGQQIIKNQDKDRIQNILERMFQFMKIYRRSIVCYYFNFNQQLLDNKLQLRSTKRYNTIIQLFESTLRPFDNDKNNFIDYAKFQSNFQKLESKIKDLIYYKNQLQGQKKYNIFNTLIKA